MSGLVVPELARSWFNYFREKGGAAPTIPQEIVPVVIMDDNTNGPFPACRLWHYGTVIGAAVGNFSYLGILNNDDAKTQKSACVIDRIFAKYSVGVANFTIGVVGIGALAFSSSAQVRDAVMEKELSIGFAEPILGNVLGGVATDPVNFNTAQFPSRPVGEVVEIPGPFIVGPQQQLLLTTSVNNFSLQAYFRGRYYPSL